MIADALPYAVGDFAYYDVPGGQKGKILDIRIGICHAIPTYLISFGPGQAIWVEEDEITTEKVIE